MSQRKEWTAGVNTNQVQVKAQRGKENNPALRYYEMHPMQALASPYVLFFRLQDGARHISGGSPPSSTLSLFQGVIFEDDQETHRHISGPC